MNKKQRAEIIKAIMITSGMDPYFDDDYYGCTSGSTVGAFLRGIITYFELPGDPWIVNFRNLEYLDSPSETFEFLLEKIPYILEEMKSDKQ